jgi:hypothetical protein
MHPLFWLWYVLLLSTSLLAQREYSYSYIPKQVFENQLFSITVRETQSDANAPVEFYFSHSESSPLFKHPSIVRNGNQSFYTFYFKANKRDIVLPTLTVINEEGSTPLFSRTIEVVPLKNTPSHYVGVLANTMEIKSYQTSHYDENNFILVLQLEAMEANLEAFQLIGYDHSAVEIRNEENGLKVGEVSILVSSQESNLTFSYYNTVKHKFIGFQVPVEITKSTLIPNEELNPTTDSFLLLKRYTLSFLAFFFFIMFLWKRDFLYLLLLILLTFVLYRLFIPHKEVCVKEGSPLYLLPTPSSTIGMYIKEKTSTMSLAQRNEYIKIEYLPGVTGWIKYEDTCNP